jgi:OmpA-OmpF porin, OOP family
MKRFAIAALFAAGLLGTTSANAQWIKGKIYVGGAFGQTDVDSGVTQGLITSGTVDGKDTGFKIFGGLQFHPNFAAEAAYVDLGTVNYSGNFGALTVTNGTIDIQGFSVGVVGSLPLGERFSLHGRVGFWGWEQEARDTTGGFPFSAMADGSDIYYGIGATFHVTKMIGVRAEWEQYKMNSDKASLATLGVLFRF